MSSHSLDSHTLSLMDAVLSTKPPYWSPIPRWLESDEVQLVPALWHISLTQWQLRGMEHQEMKRRKSAGRGEVREEGRVWRTERRGYGNTGGVNARWRVNPYEYRRMGGEVLVVSGGQPHPRETSMAANDAIPSHDFHAVSHRMERKSLVAPGGQLHPREASMVARNTTPPANENAPPQDFQAFLMGIEGTLFLNSLEEAGRFAQQRRR